jgi:hypothetical protein
VSENKTIGVDRRSRCTTKLVRVPVISVEALLSGLVENVCELLRGV